MPGITLAAAAMETGAKAVKAAEEKAMSGQ
jgi:hypothetical protein